MGVEAQGEERREEARALDEGLQATVRRLAELTEQVQADKDGHMEQMRRKGLVK